LRVGTYNIRNTTDLYSIRKNMLRDVVKKMNADVFGLQEVSFVEYNQINDLFTEENRNDYSQYKAKTQLDYARANEHKDPNFKIDGNAICVKSVIERNSEVFHNVLHLSPVRNAQMLGFNYNGLKINLVNVHLHHLTDEEGIRVHQMYYVLKWIQENTGTDSLTIVVGDYNAVPNSDTYNLMTKFGYISAHADKFGREPEKTFHNKMDCPDTKDDDPDDTFDYVFFLNSSKKFAVKVNNVEIYGTEESTERKLIFASDHYALVSEFIITEY